MSERKTISVVCVFAAGEEDGGYPHLEGLFKEGKEYTLVYHKEEEVFLVKDDKVPLEWCAEWCAEYNGGGQWSVEGLGLIAEFKEL